MIQKLIICIMVGIPMGLVFAVPVTPFAGLLRIMFLLPSAREKLRVQAEAKGHVVEAELKKSYDDIVYDKRRDDYRTTNEVIGVYYYYVNGRKYKCKLSSTTRLPKKITLYYIKKPRHATTEGRLGNYELPWGKIYLCVSLLLAVVFVILLMIKWEEVYGFKMPL